MAANPIPTTLDELFTMAEDAADGANQFGAAIGLHHNTEPTIRADLTDAMTKEEQYQAARSAKKPLSTEVRVQDSNTKAFILLARDVLVPHLGGQYNEAWLQTGFPNNSLQVPGTRPARQALLAKLRDYFTANPTKENAALNVTATRAGALFTALSDARSALHAKQTEIGQKKVLRDAAVAKLEDRMRGLIGELEQLLDPLDPRWLAFGLNMPGAPETPDPVESLLLTLIGPTAVFADWDNALRALRYHVEIFVVGVDTDFRHVQTVIGESEATLTDLPAGRTVRVRIISVNDAGSAPPSGVVEIAVPATP